MEHPEGIRYEATDVEVYQLEDVCVYEYRVQRNYYEVPIVMSLPGHYQYYSTYTSGAELTRAYISDRTGVTAFAGIPYNEELIPLLTEEYLISLADAADILEENLASQINASVESVGLVYLPLTFQPTEDTYESIVFPCWKFSGINRVKDEQVMLYVDALTGEVYLYSFNPLDQEFDLGG